MGRVFAFLVLVLVVVLHASHARNVPGDGSMKEQTLQADARQADSSKGSGVDDKKNFVYGGVGGFAGVGGIGGLAGGIPLLGGLGGIGGAAGIGGYTGIGGLGGLGGVGVPGGLGGPSGVGEASQNSTAAGLHACPPCVWLGCYEITVLPLLHDNIYVYS
ncbi:hypothetical protein GQ457_07G016380 [Hibiscus cannabinus]